MRFGGGAGNARDTGIGTSTGTPDTSTTMSSFIVRGEIGAGVDASALGTDRPDTIDGFPVKYRWKPMLRPGRYHHPKQGAFALSRHDIVALEKHTRDWMKNEGGKPYVPTKHKGFDAKDNMGWVIETKVDADGTLWGLHQLIGEDAHKAAARNESSVSLRPNFKSGRGKTYPVIIEHNALCPDPVIEGLGSFVAFSRAGGPEEVPVYTLAAQTEGFAFGRSSMDPITIPGDQLQLGRDFLGQPELAPEQLIPALIRAGDAALADAQDVQDLRLQLSRAQSDLGAARLQLSRSGGDEDPKLTSEWADVALSRMGILVDAGDIPQVFAERLKAEIQNADGTAGPLMLSRSADGSRIVDKLLAMFKGAKLGVASGTVTPPQQKLQLARQDDATATEAKAITESMTAQANGKPSTVGAGFAKMTRDA